MLYQLEVITDSYVKPYKGHIAQMGTISEKVTSRRNRCIIKDLKTMP